jgi:hypothetical protein
LSKSESDRSSVFLLGGGFGNTRFSVSLSLGRILPRLSPCALILGRGRIASAATPTAHHLARKHQRDN